MTRKHSVCMSVNKSKLRKQRVVNCNHILRIPLSYVLVSHSHNHIYSFTNVTVWGAQGLYTQKVYRQAYLLYKMIKPLKFRLSQYRKLRWSFCHDYVVARARTTTWSWQKLYLSFLYWDSLNGDFMVDSTHTQNKCIWQI